MAAASTSALPIVLGQSFGTRGKLTNDGAGLVSIKYNFRPPSLAQGATNPGLLHCPKKSDAEWLLEFASDSPASSSSTEGRSTGSSHAFSGSQTQAKDVDCILTWDDERQAYVLEKISTCFSMRYERKQTSLSTEARQAFRTAGRSENQQEDTHMVEARTIEDEEGEIGGDDADEDDEEFAAQLQRDLDAQSDHLSDEQHAASTTQTGLGLINASGMHEEVITPRGSPFVDRTAKMSNNRTNDLSNSIQMRSTPGMSPVSVANSPRPTGLESSLSSTWRPPAQRSNVALTYGDEEDDDDDEEEDESDEEEEEEEEGADDDDDLDAFARELEGSLMEPPTPVEEVSNTPSTASTAARTRRVSNRSRK